MAFVKPLQRPGTGSLAGSSWCQEETSAHTLERAVCPPWKQHRPLHGCSIGQISKWRCQASASCSRAHQRRQRQFLPQHRWPGPSCSSSKLYVQQQHASWTCIAAFEDEAQFADDYGLLSNTVETLGSEVREALQGNSIYLVGMMGSGKSTVGKLLGKALEYPLIDTDGLIQQLAGQTIAEIFAHDGEEAFRDLETLVLQQVMPFKACVVATGGGAVLRRQNWGYMQHAVVVWLSGSPELLARRTIKDGLKSRPLLAQVGEAQQQQQQQQDADADAAYEQSLQKLTGLLETRRDKYAVADLEVSLEAGPSSTQPELGAPAAIVTYRVLSALQQRLRKDAQDREDLRQFEIKGSGDVPSTLRVVQTPAAQRDGDGQ